MIKKSVTNEEVFDMLDYLAWCNRCLFEDEFKKKFMFYCVSVVSMEITHATWDTDDAWRSIKKRGIVGTFQEYISCKDFCKALVYAINPNNKVTE